MAEAEKNEGAAGARAPWRRRVLVGAAVVVVVGALIAVCWRLLPSVYDWLSDPAAVHALVDEHPVLSRLAIGGLNALQISLAFLPGEPVELASGYAFGFWEGTLICLLASAVASSAIFWAVRRWGWSLVGVFFDRSHLERFSWLHNARRLEIVMFVVFLIPGTPKDFLTYFAGLTSARYLSVLAITTIGRIPSVVTSTMAAHAFGSGNYVLAVGSVVAAVLLAAVGALAYKHVEAHLRG